MKLLNLFDVRPILLEAKARIEHPEDMIFDQGRSGALHALDILQKTAQQPEQVTIKFDGSPALILGWKGDQFVLTDKAGFGAKGYDGLTTSAQAVEQMILNRKVKLPTPEAQAARRAYASKISSLYDKLKAQVGPHMQGYVQADLLYTDTPPIIAGSYVFKPNKIEYRVPVNSDLGKQIAKSKVGLVVHSRYDSPSDQEPQPVHDVQELGWKSQGPVLVVPHVIADHQPLSFTNRDTEAARKLIKSHAQQMDDFFDPETLTQKQLKSLPALMKAFLAHKAGKGESDLSHAAEEFLQYVMHDNPKVTDVAKKNILNHVQQNLAGYNAIWNTVNLIHNIKMGVKAQLDQKVGGQIQASLDDQMGHEGFVSVTPQGIIKLVNRAEFMKKTPAPLVEQTVSTKGERAVWTFGRLNPPTQAHQMLMNKLKQLADGQDYWIFLSHSQDPVKNPLSWQEKTQFVKQIAPDHAAHVVEEPNIKTPLQAADWLYDQGYTHLTLVVGGDRLADMEKLLQGWNSPEIREKYNRQPITLEFVSAGDRDPDQEGMEGISATKARQAVKDADLPSFEAATGLQGKLASQLFDAVAAGMQKPKPKSKLKEQQDVGHIVTLKLTESSAHQLHTWCEDHGIECMHPDHLHLTVITTPMACESLCELNETTCQVEAACAHWSQLGERALVLQVKSDLIEHMHDRLVQAGAQHKFDSFIPHVSVNYQHDAYTPMPRAVPDFTLKFDKIQVEQADPNFAQRTLK